jgi:signal transduction histidine kinase
MPPRTERAPLRQPLWAGVAAEMLLDRVAQGVLIVSWDGKVTYANHTVAAMARRPHSSLPGTPLLELIRESERERLGIALGAGREALTHQRFALHRADASELPVLMTFAPLAYGQASCLVSDLSEQKRREESADRLSSFLGTLAHELRSILSPMRRSLRVLGQEQGLDADGRRELEALQRHAERMLLLVEDLRKING